MVLITGTTEAANASGKDDDIPSWPGVREGIGELEFELTLEAIELTQRDIASLTERANEEKLAVKREFHNRLTDLYGKRSKLLGRFENFWLSVFLNCRRMNSLMDADDRALLRHLKNVEVEATVGRAYKLHFHFSANKYFKNQLVVREYSVSRNGNLRAANNKISWIPPWHSSSNTLTNGRGRRARRQTFLSWLATPRVSGKDDLGEWIKDRLWPNPIRLSLLSALKVVGGETRKRKSRCSAVPVNEDIREFVEEVRSLDTLNFLREQGILQKRPPLCPECEQPMRESPSTTKVDPLVFVCPVHKKEMISVRYASCLNNSRMTLDQFLIILMCWVKRTSLGELSRVVSISMATCVHWFRSLNAICTWFFSEHPRLLGGPGRAVFVEEVVRPKGKAGYDSERHFLMAIDVGSGLAVVKAMTKRASVAARRTWLTQVVAAGSVIVSSGWAKCLSVETMKTGHQLVHRIVNEGGMGPVLMAPVKNELLRRKSLPSDTLDLQSQCHALMWRQEFARTDEEAFDNILQHIAEWTNL